MLASTTSKVVFPSLPRSVVALAAATSLLLMPRYDSAGQGTQQTVVAILAHADDETPAGPILARYAREGARVFLIVATDGGQGTGGGGSGVRRDSVPPDELARTRGEEARWGPDGGVGHPDHRIVSGVITQLVRAGAPGAPERLYYIYLPAEAFRAM